MRVYLPTTMPGLADILAKDEVGPSPLRAFAVTPALREAYASGDDEELEYVAMLAAATASLRLLHADAALTTPCAAARCWTGRSGIAARPTTRVVAGTGSRGS